MTSEDMKQRTKSFAFETARFIMQLEYSIVNKAYSNQLIRCSSSLGANYRAVRRAKSKADFINKLKIVEEELDESLFFLERLVEFNQKDIIQKLMKEAEELLRIIVATLNTARNNKTSNP